jgi:hypothetical protein
MARTEERREHAGRNTIGQSITQLVPSFEEHELELKNGTTRRTVHVTTTSSTEEPLGSSWALRIGEELAELTGIGVFTYLNSGEEHATMGRIMSEARRKTSNRSTRSRKRTSSC